MKVIYNGGLNASTLDGWWAEGYDTSVGWAIGNGEEYPESQENLQDTIEAQALYNLLEQDIVPLFYERSRDGLPRGWIERVKNSIRKLAPFFNTNRMVLEYAEQYYMPACTNYERLTIPDLSRGIAFANWKQRLVLAWPKVKVLRVETSGDELKIGSEQQVRAWVDLGDLTPEDVTVQLYYGTLDTHGEIIAGDTLNMNPIDAKNSALPTACGFETQVAYRSTGQHGISVRVLPCHEDLPTPFLRGMVRWAE
jgi:starch phosphorylase